MCVHILPSFISNDVDVYKNMLFLFLCVLCCIEWVILHAIVCENDDDLPWWVRLFAFTLFPVGISFYEVWNLNHDSKQSQVNHTKSMENFMKYDEQKHCAICLEEFKTEMYTVIIVCGHKFCEKCLSKNEMRKANNGNYNYNAICKCPICRGSYQKNTGKFKLELQHV
eukprot:UN00916